MSVAAGLSVAAGGSVTAGLSVSVGSRSVGVAGGSVTSGSRSVGVAGAGDATVKVVSAEVSPIPTVRVWLPSSRVSR